MKITLTENKIAELIRNDDEHSLFSYHGSQALARHLQEKDDESGEDSEFDIDSIRSEFSEYGNFTEWMESGAAEDTGIEDYHDDDEVEETLLAYARANYAVVLEFDGGVIISDS